MQLNSATLSEFMQKIGGRRGRRGQPATTRLGASPFARKCRGRAGTSSRSVIKEKDEKPDSSPMSPNRPQPWGRKKPCIYAAVPNVPSVPAKSDVTVIADVTGSSCEGVRS